MIRDKYTVSGASGDIDAKVQPRFHGSADHNEFGGPRQLFLREKSIASTLHLLWAAYMYLQDLCSLMGRRDTMHSHLVGACNVGL